MQRRLERDMKGVPELVDAYKNASADFHQTVADLCWNRENTGENTWH